MNSITKTIWSFILNNDEMRMRWTLEAVECADTEEPVKVLAAKMSRYFLENIPLELPDIDEEGQFLLNDTSDIYYIILEDILGNVNYVRIAKMMLDRLAGGPISDK